MKLINKVSLDIEDEINETDQITFNENVFTYDARDMRDRRGKIIFA